MLNVCAVWDILGYRRVGVSGRALYGEIDAREFGVARAIPTPVDRFNPNYACTSPAFNTMDRKRLG